MRKQMKQGTINCEIVGKKIKLDFFTMGLSLNDWLDVGFVIIKTLIKKIQEAK
jgi:hypothetical protein